MRERASHARLDRPNGYSKLSGNFLVGQVAVFTEEENLLLLLTQLADRAPRSVDIFPGRQFLGRRWVMRDGSFDAIVSSPWRCRRYAVCRMSRAVLIATRKIHAFID